MSNKTKRGLNQDILVTVDTVVFTVKNGELLTLLVKRKSSARNYPSQWSLPGGIVDELTDTSTKHTAVKKLEAKTGINLRYLEQLKSYSGCERDERKWSISDAYFILMRHVSEFKDSAEVIESKWVSIDKLKGYRPFAFDHEKIINDAIQRLREKARYSLLPAYCLEEMFTLNQLHQTIEIILGHAVQKKSLYRRISESVALEKTDQKYNTDTKKAALYRTNDKTRDFTFDRNITEPKKPSPK